MNFYNPYIKLSKGNNYVAEIAFVNSKPSMIVKELYYVDFEKGEKSGFFIDNGNYLKNLYSSVRFSQKIKSGFFIDNGNYLKNLYSSVRFSQKINHTTDEETKLCLEKTKGYINSVKPQLVFYTYVKVLKDIQNPQLEDQILLFKFGRKIKDIIQNYFENKGTNQIFENSFNLIVASTMYGFYDFDKCDFSDKKINVIDNTLNLNSEISYPVLNLIAIQRREKLLQLKDNQVDYEEILNGVPIEEIVQ